MGFFLLVLWFLSICFSLVVVAISHFHITKKKAGFSTEDSGVDCAFKSLAKEKIKQKKKKDYGD